MIHPTQDMMEAFEKTISFNAKELPELLEWHIGEEYALELEIQMRSRHEEDGELTSAIFVVKKVTALGGKDK